MMALKEMRGAVIASQKAERIMLVEIDAVSNRLEQYIKGTNNRSRSGQSRNGMQILPVIREQMDEIGSKMSAAVGVNPYDEYFSVKSASAGSDEEVANTPFAKQVAAKSEQKSAPHAPRVERVSVQYDPSIWRDKVRLLREKPPDDWTSTKGTIQIRHNGYDTAVVWGAGFEGKPVYDRANGRYKVVSIKLAQPM